MRALVCLLGAVMLGSLGCESRSHTNPFDPENPLTRGTPANVTALAGDGVVELLFDPLGIEDFGGFVPWRWVEGGETLALAAEPLPAGDPLYIDATVVNGVTYGYRVEFLVGGAAAGIEGMPAFATPGPHVPWAIDGGSPSLARLTADARHVAERLGLGGPFADLAVDERDGTLWVVDEWEELLLHFDAGGELLLRREVPFPPSRVALDQERGLVWTLSRRARRLVALDESGSPRDTISVGGTGTLRSMALDPLDGTVWLAAGADGILHLGREGTLPGPITGGETYYDVAVDPLGRAVWAAAVAPGYQGIVHLFPRPEADVWVTWIYAGAGYPREVEALISPAGKPGAWVADDAGELVLLVAERENAPDERWSILRTQGVGVTSPRGLWADPTGGCWLVEGGTGRVLRAGVEGTVERDLAQLTQPRRVMVWWRER